MIKLWKQCPDAWRTTLDELLNGDIGQRLEAFLDAELMSGKAVYPPIDSVFKCLQVLSADDVKVVILGQDPYHQAGQATGRAFEVAEGVSTPPSLLNIFKMLERDVGPVVESRGLLAHWEQQGVLLLNTVLTVSEGLPESHRKRGWELITDCIIEAVAASDTYTAFLLWGAHAQKKAELVERSTNLVLTAPHPSPLSAYRGFFDCQHFSQTNEWLLSNGQLPVNWLGN